MAKLLFSHLQRFCLHDGPGIRSTLFLKGCSLDCPWCQNPETKNFYPELACDFSKCVFSDGNCPNTPCLDIDGCDALSLEKSDSDSGNLMISVERSLCSASNSDGCEWHREGTGTGTVPSCIDKCDFGCFYVIGQESESESDRHLVDEIMADEHFFRASGGGITISGGEPLLQSKALKTFLTELRVSTTGDSDDGEGENTSGGSRPVHVLVQTSLGVVNEEDWMEIVEDGLVDEWWVDLKGEGFKAKAWGEDYPSMVSEDTVWKNAKLLIDLIGQQQREQVVKFRMPIVPGLNDSEKSIADVARNLIELFDEAEGDSKNHEIELVPFHTLYEPKLELLETNQMPLIGDFDTESIESALERAKNMFEECGVTATYPAMKKGLARERLVDSDYLSDRVWKLMEEVQNFEPEMCLDRVELVSEYYKKKENRKKPSQIRRAEMIRHFLVNKTNKIYDGELIVGSFTSHRVSGPLYLDLHGLALLDDVLLAFPRRSVNPIKMNRGDRWKIFKNVPLWLRHNVLVRGSGGLRGFAKLAGKLMKARDTIINEAAGLAHLLPDWEFLLSRGTRSLAAEALEKKEECLSVGDLDKAQFYDSIMIVCDAMEEFAEQYALEADRLAGLPETSDTRREELFEIRDACRRVPALPPRTLQEGLQFILFYQIAAMNEALDNGICPGRIDQLVYDLYLSDLAAGVPKEDLVELFACFWIKLNEIIPIMNRSVTSMHSGLMSGQTLIVGGMTREGKDATNEVSHILLRVNDLLRSRQPNFQARIHANSSPQYLEEISQMLNRASASPGVFCDEVAIDVLQQRGLDEELARDYIPIGCVEPASTDCYFSTDSTLNNIPLCLERMMELCPRKELKEYPNPFPFLSCSDMDDVYSLFESQLSLLVDEVHHMQSIIERGIQDYAPVPLTSLSYPNALETGQDVSLGGALHNGTGHQAVGIPNVANALAAIEDVVFRRQFCSLEELRDAVAANFEGDQRHVVIHEQLLRAPKFGNDDAFVDRWAKRVMRDCAGFFEAKSPNLRGGDHKTGFYAMTTHVHFGSVLGATPDGRKAGTPFASGLSVVNGTDLAGPTAALNSVGSLDLAAHAQNGIALNLSLNGAFLDDGEIGAGAIHGLVEGHFSSGGMQIQINAHDPKVLRDARENPEKYPTLLVRVSGYTAYFTSLNPSVQDEIIERSSHLRRDYHSIAAPCIRVEAQKSDVLISRVAMSLPSFLVFLVFLCFASEIHSLIFNVRDYGAKGDGKTLDTHAIWKAFAAVSASRGSNTVLFPSGTYLTGAFNLTSNTTLEIARGATILGVMDKSQYPIIAPLPSYGRSRDVGYSRYQALVFGVRLRNVKITGEGTIDGQGKYWWNLHESASLKHGRPRLVELMWSQGIEISYVTLQNSGFWTLHPIYCEDVWIHHVKLRAPPNTPNTDGIDPDSSSNVLIEHCDISVDDDHIAIKSGLNDAGLAYNWPAKNISIRNCDLYRGYGISIGSETSGGIFDVSVSDCVIHADIILLPDRGLYIKTAMGRGNVVQNIHYENIRIEGVKREVIDVNMGYGNTEVLSTKAAKNVSTIPVIRNVTYSNIFGIGGAHGRFTCLSESPCHGFDLDGVVTVGKKPWHCMNAFGTQKDVDPKSCISPEP